MAKEAATLLIRTASHKAWEAVAAPRLHPAGASNDG